MKPNMGSTDKMIRLIVAAVISGLLIGNVISGIFGYVLLAFAAVFVLTSFVSFCPLYLPFGISTRKKDQ
ncbi:MAG: DUF2892 domain-containing protein [Saprospiraceae bacterium]|jgi:hypothetical protein|nr:DUF2892 domain-containing protein [Saprospiraceae bacterium]MDP4699293.1 DUF2892 domain-containing protein [Saprospiraceae bacterium]MDP4810811.1 DUF2892 domain-containing protein [Saprospiraceae bacterium]MDP4815343.1 DUF2892 domain-containing protein [Saprospiraceae bacterium]MDP4914644.1 DUF2892 domain-containing protein [Saprospiraceae bacterium]